MPSEAPEVMRLKYQFRHKAFVTAPIVIAGLAWGIAIAATWWGGLIFGLGAVLLLWFGVILADVLADRANAREQAGAVGPEAPDDPAATE